MWQLNNTTSLLTQDYSFEQALLHQAWRKEFALAHWLRLFEEQLVIYTPVENKLDMFSVFDNENKQNESAHVR